MLRGSKSPPSTPPPVWGEAKSPLRKQPEPEKRVNLHVVVVARQRSYDLLMRLTARSDELREKIGDVIRVPASKFWVVYEGRIVKGEWRLGTFGIHAASRLQVVMKRKARLPAADEVVVMKKRKPRTAVTADGNRVRAVEATTVASRSHAGQSDAQRALRKSEEWAASMLDEHPLLQWSSRSSWRYDPTSSPTVLNVAAGRSRHLATSPQRTTAKHVRNVVAQRSRHFIG